MPVCEICSGRDFGHVASEMREGPGRICRCLRCGLVVQDASFSGAEMESYYNEEYRRTNSLDLDRELSPREHFEARRKTIGPVVERVLPLLSPRHEVLELGCGAGELLHGIRDRVKGVVGVEIHRGFVEHVRSALGIEAHAGDINGMDFGGRRFDVIVSIATLDHLVNPAQTLATLRRLLAPGGVVYLEVPNRDEALNHYLPEPHRRNFNRFFWHKAHFFYFTRETLGRLMERAGFAAEIDCRHEYTLRNYLNWYFTGAPQRSFLEATTGVGLFGGDSDFERGMNGMFERMEGEFHALMRETFRGDTLCCVARPAGGVAG